MAKKLNHTSRHSKPEKGAGARVVGVTKDGVSILYQGPATHFTVKELREAVRIAKRAG